MNTIEKALQLAKEKEKKEAARKAAEAQSTSAEKVETSDEAPIQEAVAETTAPEKAADSKPVQEESAPARYIDLSHLNDTFIAKDERRLINEEYRQIKRKVLNNAFGPLSQSLHNSNIVMVTSPSPGEGKTFSAINLALSIALEKDKTVLLVDADVLRPNVMRTIGQTSDIGLMEYLLDDATGLPDVIHQTSVENLRIIPAGQSHHLSTELLASEKMLQAVNEFSSRYPDRIVIVDTPPLLGINETAVLANLAGQAIVVVEEGRTHLQRAAQAVSLLNPDMAKGFVINKAFRNSDTEHGYYGYAYGN